LKSDRFLDYSEKKLFIPDRPDLWIYIKVHHIAASITP